MTKKPEVIQEWLDKIEEEIHRLTTWELGFFESVKSQFDSKQWLSDKQEEIIERIYSERTS